MTEETLLEEPAMAVVPAWNLQLEARETLVIFRSLQVYLQALSQQADPPLDSLSTVVELLKVVKPAAVEAAQFLTPQPNGCT